jgi:dolichol-phosphate mannosyltransferase
VIPPLAISTSHERRFSLVIPTYNEAQNVERIVQILTNLLDRALPNDYELIVVDDDSADQTWKLAAALTSTFPHLRVIRRQQERGLSTAVIRGWQAARGEILGVIDGDLQHPPEVLLQLLRAMHEGADLAVASRHVPGGGVSEWSLIRRFLSRGAQLLGLLLLPQVVGAVSDPMSGYFMVRREAIANYPLHPLGYKILLEVIGRGDVTRIAEAGYVFQERQEGESKVTWRQYVAYLLHLVRLRLYRMRAAKKPSVVDWLGQKYSSSLKRFLRFGLVGLSGVFVDMTVFFSVERSFRPGLGANPKQNIGSRSCHTEQFLLERSLDVWRSISRAEGLAQAIEATPEVQPDLPGGIGAECAVAQSAV